jgi:predicted AAA+ superfamily ATPase
MYIPRAIDKELSAWRQQIEGKPLLVRGARQVGKSTAVKELSRQFDYYLEVNFEEQRQVHKLFEGDLNPKELCENLSILYNVPMIPGKTLLFLTRCKHVSRPFLRFGFSMKNILNCM